MFNRKNMKSIASGFLIITLIAAIFLVVNHFYLSAMGESHRCYILNGRVIFIDPGHGGKDNGTSWKDVLEDEINLILAKKLYEKMVSYGAVSYISRTGDYDLASMYARNRKDEDMKRRTSYINSIGPDIFISIHLNYYPSANVRGAQVFYNQSNEKAGRLATALQNALNEINYKRKEPKKGDYYLTNNSIYPGVIIECGFISNPEERQLLTTDSYQDLLIEKITKGIVDYFNAN